MVTPTPRRTRVAALLVLLCRAAPCAGQDEAAPPTAPADAEDGDAAAPAPPPVEKLPPLPADAIVPRLSFSNPFNQYENGVIPGWQYGGDATLANDYISLTPSQPNKVGWIWSEESVSSMDAWEVSLEFHIGGAQERGAGGGMAFWFTSQQGRTGPIYGHEDTYEGLGIFFDTYEGDDPDDSEPFVVAMMNYGATIGGEGDNPNYYDNQVGVCFAAYRNLPHLVRARIVWSGGKLQLWLDLDHSGKYQSCVQTTPGDERLKMPKEGYFGVTASTGSFGDSHVVYSLTLANLEGQAAVESTLWQGKDAEVPIGHAVHHEGRHHETHVKVATHPAQLDAAHHTPGEKTAGLEEQAAAHTAPVPPVQSDGDYVTKLSADMSAVKAALHDLGEQVRKGSAILELRTHELSEQMQGHTTELGQQVAAVPAAASSHAAITGAKAAAGGAVDAMALEGTMIHMEERLSTAAAKAAADAAQQLKDAEGRLGVPSPQLEQLVARLVREQLAPISRELAAMKALEQSSNKLLADSIGNHVTQLLREQTDLKALLSAVKEEQKASGGSGAGWLMPTLVCGQMLVVAAFLFMRSANDKKRGHII